MEMFSKTNDLRRRRTLEPSGVAFPKTSDKNATERWCHGNDKFHVTLLCSGCHENERKNEYHKISRVLLYGTIPHARAQPSGSLCGGNSLQKGGKFVKLEEGGNENLLYLFYLCHDDCMMLSPTSFSRPGRTVISRQPSSFLAGSRALNTSGFYSYYNLRINKNNVSIKSGNGATFLRNTYHGGLSAPLIQKRSHYSYSGPGTYNDGGSDSDGLSHLRTVWKDRDFSHRGFTVGIGGPVGSGKTALVQQLCLQLASNEKNIELGVVTNDIFTQEDAEFLIRCKALPSDRILAVETGGCPHAAIREDVSSNLSALEALTLSLQENNHSAAPQPLLLCESGGDNLAANFSRELADLTLYVIDVAGGTKVPRKGGPGITQSDLLIINKSDLAEAVGADLPRMVADAAKMRKRSSPGEQNSDDSSEPSSAPTVLAAVKHGDGLQEIQDFILKHYRAALAMQSSSS